MNICIFVAVVKYIFVTRSNVLPNFVFVSLMVVKGPQNKNSFRYPSETWSRRFQSEERRLQGIGSALDPTVLKLLV